MPTVLKDIWRRRLRSSLTIVGVAIGVFIIVLMSAQFDKGRATSEGALDYYADKVVVIDELDDSIVTFTHGGRPLTMAKIEELERVEGVLSVAPQVRLLIDDEALLYGVPPEILGGFLGTDTVEERWEVREGRRFSEEETGVALVGADLKSQLDAEVGEKLRMHGREFEVVGILDRSDIATVDQGFFVPLADAQLLFVDALPTTFRDAIEPSDLVVEATVYTEPGVDADELAGRIEQQVEGVAADGPEDWRRSQDALWGMFDLAVGVLGWLALVIGGTTVANTMTLSVTERTQEIGMKRALGASATRIALDVLAESAVIGILGGVIGVVAGAITATVLDAVLLGETGVALFAVSWGLVARAMVFAIVLGGLAGLYPALRSARLDPVDALAHE